MPRLSLFSPALWFCFLVPLAVLIIQLAIEATVSEATHVRLHSENSPIETAQFIILLVGFVVATCALLQLRFRPPLFLSVWLLLAALGCLYVGGEEVSWGQHFLNWDTPQYWRALNDQGETNLHNTSSWLDQKPRLILELGVLIGGLLLPLYSRISGKTLPDWLSCVTPPSSLAFVAGIVLFVKLVDKVGEAMDMIVFRRASEVSELYIYYFVVLYLVFLWGRVRSGKVNSNKEIQNA